MTFATSRVLALGSTGDDKTATRQAKRVTRPSYVRHRPRAQLQRRSGTTYPANLRLLFASMTRDEWIKYAKSIETRPPMQWFTPRATSERVLSAMYAYVKALGPAGKPVPAYVLPGQQPSGPVVQFPQ